VPARRYYVGRGGLTKVLARITLPAALALLLLACEGDSAPGGETPSPAATPSPTAASQLPDFLRDVEVVPLQQGGELHIGGDTVLVIETGCFQCDGPTKGLVRVYTKADGTPVVDTLLDPAALGLGPRPLTTPGGVDEAEPVITGFTVSDDTSEMWASICVAETCGSGGLEAWSAGSRTALFRSPDGGVTWERQGTVESGGFVIERLDEERVIIGTWDADGAPVTIRTFPGLDLIEPPEPRAWPVYVHDGEVLWRPLEGGRLLDSDGEVVADFGADAVVSAVSYAPDKETGADVLVLWGPDDGGGPHDLTLVDIEGRRAAVTYRYPGFMMVAPLGLAKGHAYGNTDFDRSSFPPPLSDSASAYQPAVFDLANATVHPILDPFAGPDFTPGRNHVAGAATWPFNRVASPGACLPLLAEGWASELACLADGVLVWPVASPIERDGVTWQPVRAPDGTEGLVDSAFLTR
jgi:hypothetical protein